jgi:tRNA G18 (ribose-2'-O)-methylase SpoU
MRKLRNDELNRPPLEAYRRSGKRPFVFLLDDVRSALNVGSVFRTADAFRIGRLWLCGITAQPPHRDILKTALGATASVPWTYRPDAETAAGELKAAGFLLVAVEHTTESLPLRSFVPPAGRPVAFAFGNEVRGVGEPLLRLCDAAVEIPQDGTKHSLNIAVCAGIVAWDLGGKYDALENTKAP